MNARREAVALRRVAEPASTVRESIIQVQVRHLRALLHLAGKHDTRVYLEGLRVEASAVETRISATDGRVLGIIRADAVNEVSCRVSLIIPRGIIPMLRFAPKAALLDLRRAGRWWSIGTDDIRVQFFPTDGAWPDVRRVLPTEAPSGVAAQFNPELLARFGKVNAVLGASRDTYPVIHHNGQDQAALVTLQGHPEFAGLIMPLWYGGREVGDFNAARWARKPVTTGASVVAA